MKSSVAGPWLQLHSLPMLPEFAEGVYGIHECISRLSHVLRTWHAPVRSSHEVQQPHAMHALRWTGAPIKTRDGKDAISTVTFERLE
jgi:hypothetical protein